jgi:NAD(P)-dependent dehydrogenase (short-subunit alcohol dehydrogenase family)
MNGFAAMGAFAGKSILVTGGSAGIGFAAALHFVERGAQVFLTGRRKDELERAGTRLGEQAVVVQGDVANTADLERLFAVIRERTGSLDAVVANAGSSAHATLGSYSGATFYEFFDVNVKGVALTVQGAVPLMKEGSSIVIVGSIAASKGLAGFGLYAASKAAVRSFARTWSNDLRDKKIRVNVVSPGYVFTEGVERAGLTRESYASILPTIPMGRLGEASEIAAAIAYLASSDSSYITGAELVVDGGLSQV